MYNNHAHYGYRRLTTKEAEIATKAIDWLASKHLKPENIVMLTDKNLDRESKVLYAKVETKHFIYYRKIRYQGSDFDRYTTEVLPYLKVEKWLFPNLAWLGKKPSFGFHLKAEDVENYTKNHGKSILIKKPKHDNIEVSAKESNIEKQILVGRRIALRA